MSQTVYLVRHMTGAGEKLTAHHTIQHARSSAKMRMSKQLRPTEGAIIYAVAPQDLHEVEQHGKVETVIEGQEALF